MGKILAVLMVSIVVLGGYSYSQFSEALTDQTGSSSTSKTAGADESQAASGSAIAVAEKVPADNNEIYWSRQEIRNLPRLNTFMDHVSQKIKDEVKVLTEDKEGAAIETKLTFNGETILVTVNGAQKTYDRIFKEEQFSKLYNGTFVNYMVSREEGKEKLLILQIHPDLQAKQTSG
ncbi:DUF4362 domain-containing protein [Brevibacillus borstelensis]|uniref:DUF4362 domain-containing protein n=1 Tax=Brevibacillus borstelensis TaxID=45462 RepID=UPI0030BED431